MPSTEGRTDDEVQPPHQVRAERQPAPAESTGRPVSERDLRIAVVGTGRMGANHVERIAGTTQRAIVSALADVDADRARSVAAGASARQQVQPRVFGTIDDLVAADCADAVVLVTPGFLHEVALLQLIEADLPVLCEKPLTPAAESALRVLQAEERSGRRTIQVGFHRRFDTEYRQLKQVIDSGQLGRLLMLHFQHRNPAAPPGFTEEMLINDSVVHEFDAVRFFTGEEVTSVQVRTSRSTRKGAMRDPQLVLLETSSGLLADVEIFMNSGLGYQVEAQAVFENGVVSAGYATGMQVTSAQQDPRAISQNFYDRFEVAYDAEIQQWVDSVRAGTTSGPTAWDGYATAACCEAGVTSQRSGRIEPVRLVEQPTFYR
ncbi:Gfo/Idh/MocA family protein [Sanguibacter sp. Z1732]|uniref:Gfo/Idh/MocA family protein n=1 Tax=Sanguibacter sp. Z1732 TaxID=3435412 RepID=UPI003D9C9C5F